MRIICVARYEHDIAEGDLFIANDPHVAAARISPTSTWPCRYSRAAGSIALRLATMTHHHADVGGAAARLRAGRPRPSIYQEGYPHTCRSLRLYRRGASATPTLHGRPAS